MSRLLENRPRLVEILGRAERIIYYGAAFALILTAGTIFASAAISAEPLVTALVAGSSPVGHPLNCRIERLRRLVHS
jgi:hypothetical protein